MLTVPEIAEVTVHADPKAVSVVQSAANVSRIGS
jgi:hypothetical protein